MAEFVTVHEVGPRDGLQNEPGVIAVAQKLTLIAALVDAGLRQIEVGSFVSPKWVPQMADTDQVMAGLQDLPDGQYDVLVPNMRGWEGFVAARAHAKGRFGVAVFVSASEGFSRANLNCSIAESIERLAPVAAAAQAARVPVRGYVSCVTDCPYDGPVAPDDVAQVVAALMDVASMPVSLGDTIGKGQPESIGAMLDAVLQVTPAETLAGHYHDTGGQALANIGVSLEAGLRHFDSAAGGLGGCPYAPGAPGNVATEAVVDYLNGHGFVTGVDTAKLARAVAMAHGMRGQV